MHIAIRKKNIFFNQGFALLEIVVAMGIFSFVVLGVIGIMISVFRAQAKAVAVKEVMDNARFTMELMTRELRTSANVRVVTPSGCPTGLEFTSANQGAPEERFYYWIDTDSDSNPDAIMRVAMPSAGTVDCALAEQLTAPEVVVDHWGAYLYGDEIGSADGQPFITLHLVMRSADLKWGSETTIDLQTTVVQRARDL